MLRFATQPVAYWLCLLLMQLLTCLAADAGIDRPNIVLILADDLGWADLGCYGADLHETPHLDRLATQAMRFTQAYAAASRSARQLGRLFSPANTRHNCT